MSTMAFKDGVVVIPHITYIVKTQECDYYGIDIYINNCIVNTGYDCQENRDAIFSDMIKAIEDYYKN